MAPRSSDEIRGEFLGFFESRGHLLRESASLVPASFDPSVLLTTAGMHPLKEYFLGLETPPATRLTSCQKCFRTTDIENVGTTARHLTFFEMLGNFSIGDYFKEGAIEMAWELSLEGFGFDPGDIWITVFEGDPELGLGPDEEAIAAWEAVGVPRERIVPCPRSENFWQAGPTGPCGPCSELYLDRGEQFGSPGDLPGGENDRFLEYWNLVFMEFDQDSPGRLSPLPARNIDTGLGLNRLALIQQGAASVFETDQFSGLMALGRELATVEPEERALRILADHSRAMTFLIADGIVPSNEERGYILRRVMRRAIQQGRRIGIEGIFLPSFVEEVIEVMGPAYPDLVQQRETILGWVRGEEEGFARTLEQGSVLLDELLDQGELSAQDAFKLHDTFGFPIELTRELAAERGVPFTDDSEFDRLMDEQRARSAAGDGGGRVAVSAEAVHALDADSTRFVGYDELERETVITAATPGEDGVLVKVEDSPFYAEGGGQVADTGRLLNLDGSEIGQVRTVLRAGEDQAILVEGPAAEALEPGARIVAEVDRAARHATECNHTATHLLHAALRRALGDHVRQAGSYVGPDKLRFDFTHSGRLTQEERRSVEDEVNDRILANLDVAWRTTSLGEAQELGAMALFGEKYGDVVRMVEIDGGNGSRELCGGTHVRRTSEIGAFRILSEGSSAANVRRIEAATGPVAVAMLREHDRLLGEAASSLKTTPEELPKAVVSLREKASRTAAAPAGAVDAGAIAGGAREIGGAKVVVAPVEGIAAKALVEIADRVKGAAGPDAAVLLGSVDEGRVHLVAVVDPALVDRGVRAGDVVAAAAARVGGGGGGRDTMAQAGGRDPDALPDALEAGEAVIVTALGG
jgi:alanyl-tRNA synthetase